MDKLIKASYQIGDAVGRLKAAIEKFNEAMKMVEEVFGNQYPGVIGTPDLTVLTNRQREIFDMLGEDTSVGSIASQLRLSKRTVEAHRDMIRKKLKFSTTAQLQEFAKNVK